MTEEQKDKHSGTWECNNCRAYNWPPMQKCRVCGRDESFVPVEQQKKGKIKR